MIDKESCEENFPEEIACIFRLLKIFSVSRISLSRKPKKIADFTSIVDYCSTIGVFQSMFSQ